MSYIYRFRSVNHLLSTKELKQLKNFNKDDNQKGYDELGQQAIFLCPLDKLNDPYEGNKYIFFKGDNILFKNLLIHYLYILQHAFCLAVIAGNDKEIESIHLPIYRSCYDENDCFKKLHDKVLDKFFSQKEIKNYPRFLDEISKKRSIAQEELFYYLNSIHLYAFKCIIKVHNNLYSFPQNLYDYINTHAEKKILKEDFFIAMKSARYPDDKKILSKCFNQTMEAICFFDIHFSSLNEVSKKNTYFILRKFVRAYLDQLEKLTYPHYFVASFVKNYKNPAMWAHYGNSFKGICLQFKTNGNNCIKLKEPIKIDNHALSLFVKLLLILNEFNNLHTYEYKTLTFIMIIGLFPNLIEEFMIIEYQRKKVEMQFIKIQYTNAPTKIDFFKSLGNLNALQVYNDWYSGTPYITDANKTHNFTIRDDIRNNFNEEWRQQYWNTFNMMTTKKLASYHWEEEYRLVKSNLLEKHNNGYFYEYDIQDLHGVIFGSKVDIEIVRLIKNKLKNKKHPKLKFYKSYHDKQGNIEIINLNL